MHYERAMRIVVLLFSIGALIALALVGEAPLASLAVAAGVFLLVLTQELLPTPRFSDVRTGLEVALFVGYISAVVALTGGARSPLAFGYLLLVGSAATWARPLGTLALGAVCALAYLAAVAGGAAVAGVAGLPSGDLPIVVAVEAAIAATAVVGVVVSAAMRRRGSPKREQPKAAKPRPTELIGYEEAARHEAAARPIPPVQAPAPRPRPVPPVPADALELSVSGLLRQLPEMSAFRTLSRPQLISLLALASAALVGLALAPITTAIVFNATITLVYLVAFAFNLAIFRALLTRPQMVRITDDEARSIPDEDLPTYTVLVAAYREAEIIGRTIRALEALDYPRDRLEILLLLEEDDVSTIQAAHAAAPDEHIRIVVVPDAQPKTKPKACNYGLLLSNGEIVTIFDAEDRPDALQLRRAAVALARLPREIACVQARLQFHNERQNLLTRWFSAEYLTWFTSALPAIVDLGAPVPLGGTSMHIRRDVLTEVGAWDPFNVTEDADLGIRLHRFGYRTYVLDSVTLEEANSDFVNWVKQRSRWYKGYLQTWLVHMRQPRRLWRELGPTGMLGFTVIVGTTPLLALLNPLFWMLTAVWFLTESRLVQLLFPAVVFYPALVSVVFGNFLALYRAMVAVRLAGRPSLVAWVMLVPFYWVLMSMAAIRAFAQLLVAPSFWEKTLHGLDHVQEPAQATPTR